MKSDYEQSPLGIVSTNKCWLNVGPVLVSIGPAPSQNRVVKEAFSCSAQVMGSHLDVDFTLLFNVEQLGLNMLADTMHSSGTALVLSDSATGTLLVCQVLSLWTKKSCHFINNQVIVTIVVPFCSAYFRSAIIWAEIHIFSTSNNKVGLFEHVFYSWAGRQYRPAFSNRPPLAEPILARRYERTWWNEHGEISYVISVFWITLVPQNAKIM